MMTHIIFTYKTSIFTIDSQTLHWDGVEHYYCQEETLEFAILVPHRLMLQPLFPLPITLGSSGRYGSELCVSCLTMIVDLGVL
jgi:hypothetical protein